MPSQGKVVVFVDERVVVPVAGSDRIAPVRSLGKSWETAQNPSATYITQIPARKSHVLIAIAHLRRFLVSSTWTPNPRQMVSE